MALLRIAAVLCLAAPPCALAYRPFDGTDADVSKLHEVEIELGPVGYLKDGGGRFLTVPSLVLNYGIAADTELVAQGTLLEQLGEHEHDSRVTETGLFLKHVWRRGSLQDGSGPSVATELGVLLPELHGDSSLGASLAAIVSEKTDFGTVHLNLQYERTRTHNDDLFAGLIVEGPKAWTVRPVAEIYIDREYSASITRSLLVGAIWQFNEDLAFDFGLRAARDGRDNVRELRAGLSWAFTP